VPAGWPTQQPQLGQEVFGRGMLPPGAQDCGGTGAKARRDGRSRQGAGLGRPGLKVIPTISTRTYSYVGPVKP
jgi:hypothetical protein